MSRVPNDIGIVIELVREYDYIEEYSYGLRNAVTKTIQWAVDTGASLMKEAMGDPGPNPPSAPGAAPNRQTSKLYDSIRGVMLDGFSGGVEMDPVGEMLNSGTPTIAARPFIEPAIQKVREDYPDKLRDNLMKYIKTGH